MKVSLLFLVSCAVACGQANEYNGIYKGNEGNIFSRKPNAFLVEVTRTRKPGKALDVGMGQGRNSIYLARRGWDVTGFDASDEGVRVARAEAARLGIKIAARVSTFDEFDFGENAWDLIVLMYVPAREIAPKVARALTAGALKILLAQTRARLGIGIASTGNSSGWPTVLSGCHPPSGLGT
jgi:SAM-dependent methyltransferase